MILNRAEKTVEVKLVYYGAALSGKTTNLQTLHAMLPSEDRTALTSLKTEGDRTLFFDFLPIQFETLHGWSVQLKTYTVPGQVRYASTRRLILQGVDGIAFIADSRKEAETPNRVALQDMKANLRANQLDPKLLPIVFQYNKRDMSGLMAVEAMDGDLNQEGLPRYEAIASRGPGVKETFVSLAARAVGSALDRLKVSRLSAQELEQRLTAALPGGVEDVAPRSKSDDQVYDLSHAQVDDEAEESESALLQQAVAGAMTMASDLTEARQELTTLAKRRSEMEWLAGLSEVTVGSATDMAELIRAGAQATGAQAATLQLPPVNASEQRLCSWVSHGVELPPLSQVGVQGLGTLDYQLMRSLRPVMTQNVTGELLYGAKYPETEAIRALIVVPLVSSGRPVGLLTFFDLGQGPPWKPTEDEFRFARVAGGLLTPHARNAVVARTPVGSPLR